MNLEPADDRQRAVREHLAGSTLAMIERIEGDDGKVDRGDVLAGMHAGIVQATVALIGAKRTAAWLRALARRVERDASPARRPGR